MRKRTQLVGFEFGYWKHQQYASEFLDNALDAIEDFQWRELQEGDSRTQFSLDQELTLENLSILQEAQKDEIDQPPSNEVKLALMQEIGHAPTEPSNTEIESSEDKEDESGEIVDREELEVEEEVKRIIEDMNEIIKPVEPIVDLEPIVIIRLRESEAASFLTSELSQKNVMSYTFEIFDNGIGMHKGDMRKFGKYLASSKSLKLKQTRGSQGFGAPSAFSDAQNTTGKPIVAVSKSKNTIYATVSEFFTTSKNEKKYLVRPTDCSSPFLHGTYIKLQYLNVKYTRGFVDTYIKETALLNPHITLIFIDPYGKEWIYRRLVSSFPKQPKYAKPHPSSTNIGDLQDLLTKAENFTISAFLQDNFVRLSSKTAKEILKIAERDLEDKISLMILKNGFINKLAKRSDPIYFFKYETRVYGRSTKPRDKLIIYNIESEELKNKYWESMDKNINLDKTLERLYKEIKKHRNRIDKSETKKDIKKIEKEINNLLKERDRIFQEREKIKNELEKIFKDNTGLIEAKKLKNRVELEDLINEVQIFKVKPSELTNNQFNSLFHGFKSIKYMSPPTDTAIPVGDIVLENTLIKEIGLKISENIDDFDAPIENVKMSSDILQEELKKDQDKARTKNESEIKDTTLTPEDVKNFNTRILVSIDIKDQYLEPEEFQKTIEKKINSITEVQKDSYSEVFDFFTEIYTKDDDFVSAETRPPTSGKGLAYVVEAALAYCNDSKKLDTPKRSRDVLSRFVNRTPKLRDSADCAITKAVQSVNWKNYKLEVYDNGLPKGPIKLLVNVSGPYVHLMFKSQSKNALAEDEDLLKEIKFCLEAIGRRLRVYLNRKANIRKSEKRAGLIEKYIPIFVQSTYNIVSQGEGKYKGKISEQELENLMRNAIGVKPPPKIIEKKPLPYEKKETIGLEPKKVKIQWEDKSVIEKIIPVKKEPSDEFLSKKTLLNWTINQLKEYCIERNISLPSKARKSEIIKFIQEFYDKGKPGKSIPLENVVKVPLKIEPVPPGTIAKKRKQLQIAKGEKIHPQPVKKEPTIIVKQPKPMLTQTQLPIITTEKILDALSEDWQPITALIFKMKIKDMMDARFLQIKLKELERKGLVIVETKMGKKHWKSK
ncbi:MAG: hypothetical protein ACTSQR_01840 [Promethearchaeota archaeon]